MNIDDKEFTEDREESDKNVKNPESQESKDKADGQISEKENEQELSIDTRPPDTKDLLGEDEKSIEEIDESGEKTNTVTSTLDIISSSIDMIYNEEESWSASDSTKKELEEFVEQLNTKQFKLVENFFTTMPKLSHTVKVTNPQTNVESDVVLEGLAAFFS